MDLSKLKQVLENEPKFRFKQVYRAVYQDLIESWQEATSLPAALRETLERECSLAMKAEFFSASDGTIKALVELRDGKKIETVLMSHRDGRRTICVSSQVGCPMGCLFCATGKIGFERNLEREEIIEQVILFARRLKSAGEKISNVVFMGMGEPFLNYDNVLAAIKFLNDKETLNLGARRFSISTAGVTHGIRKLSGERLEINLAFSLHAADDRVRDSIMPINKKYPLAKVMKEIKEYAAKTRRRVMFEYIMINGLNDSPDQARLLARLLRGYLGFVNLITYNQTGLFKASPPERVRRFKEILEKSRIAVIERHRFGEGIDAACGQLAGKSRNT